MLNRVSLIGRLGNDVEFKEFEKGSVANFNVATDDSYTDKEGNKVERTDWHKIVVHGKLAENCNKFIRKGSLVSIEGKIKYRDYENKDGHKVDVAEIIANQVIFLDKKES